MSASNISLAIQRAPDGTPVVEVVSAPEIPPHLQEEFDDVLRVVRESIVTAHAESRLRRTGAPFMDATARGMETVARWCAERLHGADPSRVVVKHRESAA